MKLSLERLDTRGLRLEQPGVSVTVTSSENLRGTLELDAGRTSLPDLRADAVALAALRLVLGALVLATEGPAVLRTLAVALGVAEDRAAADVTAVELLADHLTVDVGDVTVRGRASLGGVRLVLDGERGSLSAERVELDAFHLRIGDVDVRADAVRGDRVTLGWGAHFELRAARLEAPAIAVSLPDVRLMTSGVSASDVALAGPAVSIGQARVGEASLDLHLHANANAESAEIAESEARAHDEPFLDRAVLDALAGQLDVDAAVDLTVPILGRRRATHRLRVPIDAGTVDFLALEHNLSKLEDALLDFSVRDGALVLERVNPLRPTRGHGKPVVAWPLSPADLELAKKNRVRLAVLPTARVVGSDEPKESGPPTVALRHLGLLAIHANLTLAPRTPTRGILRPTSLSSLSLSGDVQYDPGEPAPPGAIHGRLEGFAASVVGLPLGTSTLGVGALSVGAMTDLEVTFADVTPTHVRLRLRDVTLDGLRI